MVWLYPGLDVCVGLRVTFLTLGFPSTYTSDYGKAQLAIANAEQGACVRKGFVVGYMKVGELS